MTRTSVICFLRVESSGLFAESAFACADDESGVETKAIVRPSGDHTGEDAPFGASVRERASPPSSGMRWICAVFGFPSSGSGVRTNAISRPLGDQRGDLSLRPDVNGRGGALPSDGTTYICVSYRSLSSFTFTSTKATCDPFGEIRGSAAHTNLKKSGSVLGRRPCAT